MEDTETKIEYPFAVSRDTGVLMRLRKVWDCGNKAFDRYTATFEMYNTETGKWDIFSDGLNGSAPKGDPSYKKICCLGMSEYPFNPQGFGQGGSCVEGKHLGKRVNFSSLPPDVKRCIMQYLEG